MLTTKDVAERLGVSTRTVTRMIDSGDLVAHKVGRGIRVKPETVEAYLSRQATADFDPDPVDVNAWLANHDGYKAATLEHGEAAAAYSEADARLRHFERVAAGWRNDAKLRAEFMELWGADDQRPDEAIRDAKTAKARAQLRKAKADAALAEARYQAYTELQSQIEPRFKAAKTEYDAVRPAWAMVESGIATAKREKAWMRREVPEAERELFAFLESTG